MKAKNKYANRSKISEKKLREIIRYFTADIEAQKISNFTEVKRNTINRYLKEIRKKIAEYGENLHLAEK